MNPSGAYRRIYWELRRLEQLKLENKFSIEADSWGMFDNKQPPLRFNGTTVIKRFWEGNSNFLLGRIFPQADPYCQASFLIEIQFPEGYPFRGPTVLILDPMYHPRVSESGTHFYWRGRVAYTPSRLLVEVVEEMIGMIDKVYDPECASEYLQDYQAFYQKALDITLAYGRPRS